MRIVADLIRGKRVELALHILQTNPKHPAARLHKLLLSAISNWQAKNEGVRIEESDLYVKEIQVDGGRILKRIQPAPQGRAHRIRKRSNHVTIILDSLSKPEREKEESMDEDVKAVAKAKAAPKTKAAPEAKATPKPKAAAKPKAGPKAASVSKTKKGTNVKSNNKKD